MVNTEERGSALGSHSDKVSCSHMTSPHIRLFVEQWEAAFLCRVEITVRLWAVGWWEENWRY